jgi:hypothetical protein
MQHFAHHAVNAFQEAIGFIVFARADAAARTLKLKITKTTTKTV